MTRAFDLAVRRREPELMDAPDLPRELHRPALDALARVNRISMTSDRAWTEVEQLWRDGVRPVRVLDVACGGGDVLLDLARRALRRGIEVDLLGCDISPVALERARERGRDTNGVSFRQLDALADPLPAERHVVLSTLFLHHLSRGSAVRLLRALAGACVRTLLVQDLLRSRLGYGLTWLGLHLLTRSTVAHHDGLASVRSAFTLGEAHELCREAGLASAEVRPCWPQRFTLRWIRP